MAEGCIFCKIAGGEMEAKVVHEEEDVIAFEDINARKPVHVLVVPKQHISSLAEIGALPEAVAWRLFGVAHAVAEKTGVDVSGYAVRINNGRDAGQEVPHLHMHVLGGEWIRMP